MKNQKKQQRKSGLPEVAGAGSASPGGASGVSTETPGEGFSNFGGGMTSGTDNGGGQSDVDVASQQLVGIDGGGDEVDNRQ